MQNERLNAIRAAKWGAAFGVMFWMYRVVTEGRSLVASTEDLSGEAGALLGTIAVGALGFALVAAVINFMSGAK
jgi:hypothetical protein